jgi:hypothetical protein
MVPRCASSRHADSPTSTDSTPLRHFDPGRLPALRLRRWVSALSRQRVKPWPGPDSPSTRSASSNSTRPAQTLAVLREWGIAATDERLNPLGSGISLGHPIGATGARILATGAREAVRREVPYFLETLCIGGGQGIAAVFETIR